VRGDALRRRGIHSTTAERGRGMPRPYERERSWAMRACLSLHSSAPPAAVDVTPAFRAGALLVLERAMHICVDDADRPLPPARPDPRRTDCRGRPRARCDYPGSRRPRSTRRGRQPRAPATRLSPMLHASYCLAPCASMVRPAACASFFAKTKSPFSCPEILSSLRRGSCWTWPRTRGSTYM
jgi:hypothetical protein